MAGNVQHPASSNENLVSQGASQHKPTSVEKSMLEPVGNEAIDKDTEHNKSLFLTTSPTRKWIDSKINKYTLYHTINDLSDITQ